jgi:2,3-bisphosphoglycerate-independent phosphoglycerate mutase
LKHRPLLLVVLDGWGQREEREHNAVAREGAFFAELCTRYPHALLSASGHEVGLPLGLMGNSEVGHLNLGAGRIVYQEITRIDRSIADGDFFTNGALVGALLRAKVGGKRLHLAGLVSDGGVHSSERHVRALLELARRQGLQADRVLVHAFLDGRDTPPRSGAEHLSRLERDLAEAQLGRVASVVGRYWAMDRDQRWERTQRAYDLLVSGRGTRVATSAAAIAASYAADKGDEFCEPFVVGEGGRIADGDVLVCFNFRADRMRQLCLALAMDDFAGFPREPRVRPDIVTMTQYRADFPFPVAFPGVPLEGLFADIVSEQGLRQERLAETEKYAHVTYFFSGGREALLPGESRTLVPSPKVATYDLRPEMSAALLTDKILRSLERGETDVYVINFANADMVGHTGIWEAACAAVRAVDACLKRIVPEVVRRGGLVAITADHGNAELMVDPVTGEPHTAHTTNPVPIVLCADDVVGMRLRPMGVLADVAPTLLELAGLPKSPGMDGVSLLA